jgi:hypothetical protein
MWHLIFAKRPLYFFRAHITLIFAYAFFYDTCDLDTFLHVGPTCQQEAKELKTHLPGLGFELRELKTYFLTCRSQAQPTMLTY